MAAWYMQDVRQAARECFKAAAQWGGTWILAKSPTKGYTRYAQGVQPLDQHTRPLLEVQVPIQGKPKIRRL